MDDKKLDVTCGKELPDGTKVFGNPDVWKLLCKASNDRQGWMKSTKVMYLSRACGYLVQCETQQRNPDGSYALSQSMVYVSTFGAFNDLQ